MKVNLSLKGKLTNLYEGSSRKSQRFRYGLRNLDIVTVIFLLITTFFYEYPVIIVMDVVFGFYIAMDYLARLWISPKKKPFLLNTLNITDVVVILSFLSPLLGASFAFLRSLRILRLLRLYRLQNELTRDFEYFRLHEDVILSAMNLFIFIFLVSELVFVTQVKYNEHVTNFLDAMYFTIAALTTTGFGDIILHGNVGRVLSIVIMIFGVSLFLRLVQTTFRPSKVRFTCAACGLFLHENDAVHCKHCGIVLNIPSDGSV